MWWAPDLLVWVSEFQPKAFRNSPLNSSSIYWCYFWGLKISFPPKYVNLVQNRCVWHLCTYVAEELLGAKDQSSNFEAGPSDEHTWNCYFWIWEIKLPPYLYIYLCFMWQAGNLMSCFFFPLAHSSFPAGVRLGAGSLTSGPGSQPGRPSPRAMAPLQSQLCSGAPWLWRNLEEHKVSFVNSWKHVLSISPGILTFLWGFYGSTVNIFQYWLWST